MANKWFYLHKGQTEGPFSVTEIKERIAGGQIQEEDRLWPEGTDPKDAMPPSRALDFMGLHAGAEGSAGPAASASPLPEWLSDARAMETKGPLPGLAPTSELPDWLEDLRLWVALELYSPASHPLPELPEGSPAELPLPPQSQGVPDWLEGWTLEEKPKRRPRVGGISKEIESWVPEAELALPLAEPVEPIKPVKRPRSQREKVLVDQTIQETGFDPRTGRIVDPDQFRRWQKTEGSAARPPGMSNAALFKVFRKARTAIDNWVDDEKNRLRILHAELEEIKQTPAIQAILNQYAPYGEAMLDKLTRHLAFMVENRKMYYLAMGKSK
jgi:hypothetical protein